MKLLFRNLLNKLKDNRGFWNFAIPAAIGAAQSFLNRPRQQQQEFGYDIVDTTPPWATEGTQRNLRTMEDQYRSIMEGHEPAFMSYYDQMNQAAQQQAADRFYGTAGRPGTLRDITGVGAMTGVGPKATMALTGQAMTDYMSEANKIDQYFNQMRGNYMSNASMQLPGMIQQGYQGVPQNRLVQYGGMPQQPQQNYDLSGIANLPWGDFGSGVKDLWGGWATPNSALTVTYPGVGQGPYMPRVGQY